MSGSVRVGDVDEAAAVRVVSGSIEVGRAAGDLRGTTVSGSITAREVQRGTVDLNRASGSIAVGVRRGTLVWLDLASTSGRAHSSLAADDAAGTGGTEEPLTLTAHSISGSVTVSPSAAAPAVH